MAGKGNRCKNAWLQGMHLLLPGYKDNGPTLEIYSYSEMLEKTAPPAANRKGFGHLAFEVDDVNELLKKMIQHGGNRLGDMVEKEIEGVGLLTFTYGTDPEGNIIEIQSWKLY